MDDLNNAPLPEQTAEAEQPQAVEQTKNTGTSTDGKVVIGTLIALNLLAYLSPLAFAMISVELVFNGVLNLVTLGILSLIAGIYLGRKLQYHVMRTVTIFGVLSGAFYFFQLQPPKTDMMFAIAMGIFIIPVLLGGFIGQKMRA